MKQISKEKPIRIFRKKYSHERQHGGAWKVAYADFVTAMMALFIVLWINGQSRIIKAHVSEYFVDPIGYNQKVKAGVSPIKDMKTPDGGGNAGHASQVGQESLEKAAFAKLAEKIKNDLHNKIQVDKLKDQITIEMVKEGMRIELLESSNAFFFDIGTAKLKPEAEIILSVLAEEIGKLPNHLIIEGHTDSRPYATTDGYTNYELSADRANAARRILIKRGIGGDHIDHVRGYADKMLRNNNDPYDITNRRISIIVKFEGTAAE
jgi:chemotaxis protein MotB